MNYDGLEFLPDWSPKPKPVSVQLMLISPEGNILKVVAVAPGETEEITFGVPPLPVSQILIRYEEQ